MYKIYSTALFFLFVSISVLAVTDDDQNWVPMELVHAVRQKDWTKVEGITQALPIYPSQIKKDDFFVNDSLLHYVVGLNAQELQKAKPAFILLANNYIQLKIITILSVCYI